jgi:hypothetical protein
MVAQIELDFDTPEPVLPEASIEARFLAFHQENPHVYERIVRKARALKAAGREFYGVGAFYEDLRWDDPTPTGPDAQGFRLNNDFRALYSRLVMERNEDLEGFFRTRTRRAL